MASSGSPIPPAKTHQSSNRSYNVASIWETAAALNDDQLRVIEELNAACSQRPVPIHVRSDSVIRLFFACDLFRPVFLGSNIQNALFGLLYWQIVDDRRSQTAATGTHDSLVPASAASSGTGAAKGGDSGYVGSLKDAVLRNTNQFHKWHSELEAACASEMEEKYKRYADLLNSHLASCDSILSQV